MNNVHVEETEKIERPMTRLHELIYINSATVAIFNIQFLVPPKTNKTNGHYHSKVLQVQINFSD